MTQRSIGSFGQRRERVEFTFDYFDETIRVNPSFGQFALLEEFDVVEDDPAAGLYMIRQMVDSLIHPDDVATFLRLARENGQEFEDLKEIVTAVIEAVTDRPTQPRSDSSDSRSRTSTSSTDDDFSLALAAVPEARPDLRRMVTMAHEARMATSSAN